MTTRTDYTDVLQRAGLTSNEALIYEYLLKNAQSPASTVCKRTNLSRSSTYHALQNLEQKGLVRKLLGSSKAQYIAEHPQCLSEFITKRKEEIERASGTLSSMMGSLLSDYALVNHSPGAFCFEGRAGMERVYSELIRDRCQVNSIVSRKVLREFIADYNPIYIAKRRRFKIASRVITPDRKSIKDNDSQDLREVRYLDFGLLPFLMDLKVTEKKVVITTFKEQSAVGIVIIDPVITQHFLALFEFLWAIARKQP